jgi:hypothetical protein
LAPPVSAVPPELLAPPDLLDPPLPEMLVELDAEQPNSPIDAPTAAQSRPN